MTFFSQIYEDVYIHVTRNEEVYIKMYFKHPSTFMFDVLFFFYNPTCFLIYYFSNLNKWHAKNIVK